MNLLKSSTTFLLALGWTGLVFAAGESVKISSPKDGANVDVSGALVAYEAAPGGNADHAVLTIDGKQTAVLDNLKGKVTLGKLSLGDHTLCVKVVDKGQAETGAEKCVKVTAANPGMWTY